MALARGASKSSSSQPGEQVAALPSWEGAGASKADFSAEIGTLLKQQHTELVQSLDVRLARQEELLEQLLQLRPARGASGLTRGRSLHESVQDTVPPQVSRQGTTTSIPTLSSSWRVENQATTARGNTPNFRMESFRLDEEDRTQREAACRESGLHKSDGFAETRSARARLEKWIPSRYREIVFGFAIFANSVFLGAELQYMAHHLGTTPPAVFTRIHYTFAAIFLAELLLRLYVDRSQFCLGGEDLLWNILDTVVVIASLVEIAVDIFDHFSGDLELGASKGVMNIRLFRILRVARIVRALRVPRIIRFVTALRALVKSILATLKSLVWAFVLLAMIMYIFGIVFTQEYIIHYSVGAGADSVAVDADFEKYWGNLFVSMFTLYKSVTGGLSWHDAVVPLESVSLTPVLLFTVFIFFTYFAVLNVVTGIFCNSAIDTAYRDPEIVVAGLLGHQEEYTKQIKMLFTNIDVDGSGKVTLDELERVMEKEEMRAHLMALGLNINDAWALFKLIDKKKAHVIDIDSFVEGCYRLKGEAKGIDIAMLASDTKAYMKKITRSIDAMDRKLSIVIGEGEDTSLDEESHFFISEVNTK